MRPQLRAVRAAVNRSVDGWLHRLRRSVPAAGGPLAVAVGVVHLLTSRDSFLRSTGWIRSLRTGVPMDATGRAVPWINVQMRELLAERMPPDARIFEFGAGASTEWFVRTAGAVVSVESDPEWFRQVSDVSGATVVLVDAHDADRYAALPADHRLPFDVIVVDAIHRSACVLAAPQWLSPGGVIIVDDSERDEYRGAIDQVLTRGFRELRLRGQKPLAVRQTISSSILYRDGNCLGL